MAFGRWLALVAERAPSWASASGSDTGAEAWAWTTRAESICRDYRLIHAERDALGVLFIPVRNLADLDDLLLRSPEHRDH